MKVLIVDDSDVALFLLENWFIKGGYQVRTAGNGLQALDVLATETVDLIVADALMPQMDGFELCYRVKCNPRTRHIPFVFCSADYISPLDERFAMQVGSSRYIVKTEDPVAFFQALEQVLARPEPIPAGASPLPEDAYLRAYTERLIQKLDEKVTMVERANERLLDSNHELRRLNRQLQETNEQLQDANERLLAANRLKDDFVSVVSHELRSPLTAIIGYTEIMRDSDDEPPQPQQAEFMDIVMQRAQDLHALVEELLEFNVLRAGQRAYRPRSVTLRELADAAAQSIHHQQRLNELYLDVQVPDPDFTIYVDPAAIRRVLIILLDNAIKFTPAGGVVTLHLAAEADAIALRVSDTGIGIPGDKLETIFESFRQLEGHVARRYQGVGLGLSIARELVELHGGRIWAESREGEGSTFNVALPRRQATPAPAAVEPAAAGSAAAEDEGHTILVVEDDQAMSAAMQMVLEQEGYTVLQSSSGHEALALCQSYDRPIHLLVADLTMPGMSGEELAHRLALIDLDVDVLFISGNADSTTVERLLSGPRQTYLAKPFRGSTLARKVREVLDASPRAAAAAAYPVPGG